MIISHQQHSNSRNQRKTSVCATLLFSLCLMSASEYSHSEISIVISNNNLNELSSADIRKIFLGKRTSFPDGNPATPINQQENSEITQQFNFIFLNRSPQQYKAYWARMVFTGKGHPPESSYSDDDIIALIKNDPSVISYIQSSSLTSDVKEILRIKKPTTNKLHF